MCEPRQIYLIVFYQKNPDNKYLSFTGVSSALSVVFVFPVQALTCTFNYGFHCLVATKVSIFFSSRSYNTYSLKTSSYLLCFVT